MLTRRKQEGGGWLRLAGNWYWLRLSGDGLLDNRLRMV
jgi:glucan-binding YG repeat protein